MQSVEEAAKTGKVELFEALKSALWGDRELSSQADLAQRLNLSEGALRVATHRFRQRFRELLRAEIAQTVSGPEEIEGEMRHLLEALS